MRVKVNQLENDLAQPARLGLTTVRAAKRHKRTHERKRSVSAQCQRSCALGGFDTHAGQLGRHRRLLTQLAEGLSSFARAMKGVGMWDDVLVMTYAEFGRRPRENASSGTDHGTAAPQLILGGRVRGGFYGEQPPLDRLEGQNLAYRLDFRALYATVARRWWGLDGRFLGPRTLPLIT